MSPRTLADQPSLNALAEARQLPAWTSWQNGRPAGYFDLPLGPEVGEFYRENGFFVVDSALSMDDVEALRAETLAIAKGERGPVREAPEFTPDMSDEDILRQILCIHFPHKISETMLAAVKQPAVIEALQTAIGPNVKCMQSMLFVKASGKPGQAWHQDEIYIPTRDRSLTGAWIALDDATVENGCLWVLPGSQKPGVLYFQEWHGDRRFDCAWEARRFPYFNDDAVPVEVKAGSIVVFNGYTLHRSLPNTAPSGFRRSLVNHYMSAESLLPWFYQKGNEAVATLDHRDVILVCGEDPYAWKGYEDSHTSHIRPDGKGGCGNFEYNSDPVISADAETKP